MKLDMKVCGMAINKFMNDHGPSWMVSKITCLLHVLLHDTCCFHAKELKQRFLRTFAAKPSRKASAFLGGYRLVL